MPACLAFGHPVEARDRDHPGVPRKSCFTLRPHRSTRSGSSGGGKGAFLLARTSPISTDALKIAPTGMMPPSLCAATAAKPIEAMHPHELQSGLPPNWQGWGIRDKVNAIPG